MSDDTTVQRATPWWLVASLLVNMLLVGVFIGGAMKSDRHDRRPADMHRSDVHLARGVLSQLSAEDRREVGDVFRRSLMGSRDLLETRREQRANVREALLRDPYDAEAVRASLAQLHEVDMQLQRALQDALTEEMARLTPQQREAIAESMLEQQRGRRRGFSRRD